MQKCARHSHECCNLCARRRTHCCSCPTAPTEETEPDTGPAAADEEDSEASSASQPAPAQEMKKRKKVATAADGDRQYPWGDGHQDTMARFWLTHPIFYDKAQQHYKNKEMRKQLMQDLIQKNHKEWEKILTPLPTGEFCFCTETE